MKYIICLLAVLCQLVSSAQPYTVGQQLNREELVKAITEKSLHPVNKALNKPLLIIDFFATWCGSCRKHLPELAKLQLKLGKQIQIIALGYENKSTIEQFMHNHTNLSKAGIVAVAADTLLHQWFPHKALPHVVVVDASGKVRAITAAEHITEANLLLLLQNTQAQLPVKQDKWKHSIHLTDYAVQPFLMSRMAFTKKLHSFNTDRGYYQNKDKSITRYWQYNNSIYELLLAAAGRTYCNRILVKSTQGDTCTLSWLNNARKDTASFELWTTLSKSQEACNQILLQQLEVNYNLTIEVKELATHCWALVKTADTATVFIAKNEKPFINFHMPDTEEYHLFNQPIERLIGWLNGKQDVSGQSFIVLNETGYNGNITLRMNKQLTGSTPGLQKALELYQLKLIPVQRNVPHVVITQL